MSKQRALGVLTLPAFQNNYLFLLHDGVHAAVVDPGDAGPVLAALDAHQLTLTAIVLTHHHNDHIGGVPALLALREPAKVRWPIHEMPAEVITPGIDARAFNAALIRPRRETGKSV